MPDWEPFEFDISAAADKKRRSRARRGGGAVESSIHKCSHGNCNLRGKYRAPVSPEKLDEFRWFCEKHIREYNLKWDYFKQQTHDPLEEAMGTERFGSSSDHSGPSAWSRLGFDDPLDLLDGIGDGRTRSVQELRRRFSQSERRALDILDVEPDASRTEIRKCYKRLVKSLHPDQNDGDRTVEERLQQVVWAWEQLRDCRKLKP